MTFFNEFGKKWASEGSVEPISETQKKSGWDFLGSVPPISGQFNLVQQNTDEKINYLFNLINSFVISKGGTLNAVSTNALRDILNNLLMAVQGGHVGYATKDGMLLDTTQEERTIAEVLSDPVAENNGFYLWLSGEWVKQIGPWGLAMAATDASRIAAEEAAADADAAKTEAQTAAGQAIEAQTDIHNNWQGKLDTAAQQAETASTQAGIATDKAAEASGSAATANSAKTAAELARDAAMVGAGVYPDEATGRAAVMDGEYFKVIGSGDVAAREYRRTNASASVLVVEYPSANLVNRSRFDSNRIRQSGERFLNLLPLEQVFSEELPTTVVNGTAELVTVEEENAVQVAGNATAARCYWRVPVDELTTDTVSAYVLIRYASAGSGGSIRLIQRDASNTQVDFTDISGGSVTPAFTDREFSGAGIPLHPNAAFLDIDINLAGAGRMFRAQYPMIAGGSVRGYRHPKLPILFPDDDEVKEATNVARQTYPLPVSLAVLPPAEGSLTVHGAKTSDTVARALNISGSSNFGGNSTAAVCLGGGLESGTILRISMTLGASNNAALGLLFGDGASARGFALRENGQLLILTAPSVAVGNLPSLGGTFSQGDRISIDARMFGGGPGDYTVRYFVDFPNGTRQGPFDVSGITSLTHAWFGVRSRADVSSVELYRFRPSRYSDEWGTSSTGSKIVYVSQSGSDSGNGSPSEPFKTINRAATEVVEGGGVIEIEGGDYREAVVVNIHHNVWLRSKKGERVNILGSEQLAITKTPGYTQVYQAPLAVKPSGMGAPRGLPVIFEWGTPSKPIPAEERHPLHRGRSHRLPYTEMFEAASLAELDTISGRGKWWWSDGVIYLAATDGSDARNGRYEARARRAFRHTLGGLRMSRIDVYFSSSYGVSFEGDLAVTEDVRVFGSYHNGFFHTSGVWHSFRDEAAGNGNDGFNGTVTGFDGPDSGNRITAVVHDPYGHDNGDDGTSYHYRSDQTVYGGLFEHNTKADVVHVTGASVTCYDTIARGSENGFYTSSAPDLDVDRVVTMLRCVNTEAYDNQFSYRSASGGVMLCSNVLAANPTDRGYLQSGDGVLRARNSRYTGDHPAQMKGGDVEVINDGALT